MPYLGKYTLVFSGKSAVAIECGLGTFVQWAKTISGHNHTWTGFDFYNYYKV